MTSYIEFWMNYSVVNRIKIDLSDLSSGDFIVVFHRFLIFVLTLKKIEMTDHSSDA